MDQNNPFQELHNNLDCVNYDDDYSVERQFVGILDLGDSMGMQCQSLDGLQHRSHYYHSQASMDLINA